LLGNIGCILTIEGKTQKGFHIFPGKKILFLPGVEWLTCFVFTLFLGTAFFNLKNKLNFHCFCDCKYSSVDFNSFFFNDFFRIVRPVFAVVLAASQTSLISTRVTSPNPPKLYVLLVTCKRRKEVFAHCAKELMTTMIMRQGKSTKVTFAMQK